MLTAIISGLGVYLYLHLSYIVFKYFFHKIEKISNDFTLKVLPGWLFASITSGIILSIQFDFPGFLILQFIFFIALLISISLMIIRFIIKPLSKPMYEKISALLSRIYH